MSSIPASVSSLSVQRRSLSAARLFYSFTAALLIALTLWGFKDFYFRGMSYPGRPITPPIRGLVIGHGIVMSLWLVLFLVQPLLVATGKRKVHMRLGMVGAVLAAAVVGVGLTIAVQSARVSPPEQVIWGLHPKPFMAVPFFAALLFAGFVGIGIWQRKRPQAHRPMILLGTFAAMSASISRIDAISALYLGTWWETAFGPFLGGQAICGLLLLARCVVTRSFDRWFAVGYLVLSAACWGIMRIATTGTWERFAATLIG